MATLTKSRVRKPLADGRTMFSWSNWDEGEYFNIYLGSYKTNLTPDEAIEFAACVAGHMTHDDNSGSDKRSTVAKLRALADNMQRMKLTD